MHKKTKIPICRRMNGTKIRLHKNAECINFWELPYNDFQVQNIFNTSENWKLLFCTFSGFAVSRAFYWFVMHIYKWY